jgi:hypothetical protein
MIADSSPSSWIARRPARWSMPVSLQPRTARHCRIVRAEDKRPVRLSRLGYCVRPHGHYQLEVALAEESDEPHSVSIVAGPLRRTNDQEQRLAEDGRTISRYDLRFARDEEGERGSCCWSRLEPLIVRLEYGDGRDDCEHTLWLAVRPRRLWVLFALLGSAILYGVVPWVSRMILDAGGLPAACSRLLQVFEHPGVWQGLMLLIVGLWLAVVISDRLQLWLRARHLRRTVRRDVQRYVEMAESG